MIYLTHNQTKFQQSPFQNLILLVIPVEYQFAIFLLLQKIEIIKIPEAVFY